jgi:peptidoglycan/xylan/chitin deacetylase (PgdA/CDA1 family)
MVEILKGKNYQIIMWNATADDWDLQKNPEYIAQDVLKGVTPGGIILLHDGGHKYIGEDRSRTVRALPKIIEELQNRGYSFVLLSDLLNIPAYR